METEIVSTDGYSVIDLAMPFLFRVGTIVVGIVSVAAALLYAKQDSLLYFPEIGGIPRRPSSNPRKYRSPAEYQLPFESEMILCQDGVKIHSWLLLHPDSRTKSTLIFFHGNAGNIGLRLPNAVQMYHRLGVNVLLVEYRGYGDSESVPPSEAGLRLDAEAALRYISSHSMVDPNRLFVFGRSLGGAVGFHLAFYAQQQSIPLAGVIVENTFLSISRMVDHLMPYVAYLKPLVLRIGWDSSRIVPLLKVPTLYLAGTRDELVPHSHMQTLFQASLKSSTCARMHLIQGGTHNETWVQGGRDYWERIKSFIGEALSVQTFGEVPLNESSANGMSIGMGSSDPAQQSAIPTMPNTFIGAVRESVSAAATTHTQTDKKDM